MKFKKLFLLVLIKLINNPHNICIYPNMNNYINDHNFFEVIIPIKMVNNSLNFYLPNNLKEEDKNKITNFIIKNKHINNLNNNQIFYKISFYKNYEEASLDKIILYENTENSTKNINSLNNIQVASKSNSLLEHSKNNILKHNKKYTNIISLNINLKNKKNLYELQNIKKNEINHILEILKIIDAYMEKKQENKNYFYKIFYNKIHKKIVGIKIFNENINEYFNVLYTNKKTKYLIVNKNFQNIQSTIIGLYKYTPVEDCFKKLRSPFGNRRDPFTKKTRMHRGQDITTPLNTSIVSVEDGTIVDCGYNKSYGYFIIVHHGYSTRDSYSSVYCHLNNILLPIGKKVLKGEVIGLSGSTGRSTGPHLHFEWVSNHDGNRINPLEIYYQNKKIPYFFQQQFIALNSITEEISNCEY